LLRPLACGLVVGLVLAAAISVLVAGLLHEIKTAYVLAYANVVLLLGVA
jgi:hypothetical protein